VAGAPGGWVPVPADVLDAGAEQVLVLGAADSLGAGDGVGVAGLGNVRRRPCWPGCARGRVGRAGGADNRRKLSLP
jgi:hypothetical protein